MTDERARNCPWCDSDQPDWLMLPGHTKACMACTVCGARGPSVPFELKREAIDDAAAPAIAAWNTLVTVAPTPAAHIPAPSIVSGSDERAREVTPEMIAAAKRYVRGEDDAIGWAITAALAASRPTEAGAGFTWPEPKFVPVESGAKLNPARVKAVFSLLNGEMTLGEQVQIVEMILAGTEYAVATPKPPVDEAMREAIVAYLAAFDAGTGTVYVEPLMRAAIRNLTGDGAGA